MARMLVGKGAEIETKDIDGRTPLSLAAADCNESVVRILLDRGANPNSEDNDGRAPLGYYSSRR
jgi:ankyrin repeat protein